MEISSIRVNGLREPMGVQLDYLYITYELINETPVLEHSAQLRISLTPDFSEIIYSSGFLENKAECSFEIQPLLKSRQRYFIEIQIGKAKKISWFETGKMDEPWQAKWIRPQNKEVTHPIFSTTFNTEKEVKVARLYICGLGLYEARINGEKVGDEVLAPGYHDYRYWQQVQTYNVTEKIASENVISIQLGDGWYKGTFGFGGGEDNKYGDSYLLIAELHILFSDGTTEIICTDSEWICEASNIVASGIYYGEDRDDTQGVKQKYGVIIAEYMSSVTLVDRLSPPIKIMEIRTPKNIYLNQQQELIIDMGQNMVGWPTFLNKLPYGRKLMFQFGEILQEGKFYRENFRFARAAFSYISDGVVKQVRPSFTFFGFRYIKVTGLTIEECRDIQLRGEVIYSELESTGYIETSNSKLNQLFNNVFWSQKGNFVDVPTDCPQRDERMGWTGDAQIFSPTASYNMLSLPFFKKYLQDLIFEQGSNGAIPMTVPALSLDETTSSSAVWGDVCTFLPWNLYKFYGDKALLKKQLPSMKKWLAYIYEQSTDYLWNKGFQFGDWLALDGKDSSSPIGGTEETLIASIYSYVSTLIVAQSCTILGDQEASIYRALAERIKRAIQDEYLSKNGRSVVNTQTAYTLLLYFELFENGQEKILVKQFKKLLQKDNYSIRTGFVGTPLICLALSKFHEDELAYTILLNEDCPSWLYAISMGATTIWERWDSVLPDGKMNPEGMNSLNHYANGSIVQWMYEYMLGIRQEEHSCGFNEIIINPKVNWRLKSVSGQYKTQHGKISVSWNLEGNNFVELNVTIPQSTKATLILENVKDIESLDHEYTVTNEGIEIILTPGNHELQYELAVQFNIPSVDRTIGSLVQIPVAYQLLKKYLPEYFRLKPYKQEKLAQKTIDDLLNQDILLVSEEAISILKNKIANLNSHIDTKIMVKASIGKGD